MSLMIVSRLSPELRMTSAQSSCSLVSGVSSRSVVMPITPFMGVRISWLMIGQELGLGARGLLELLIAARSERYCYPRAAAGFREERDRLDPAGPG
jgi:hypothetical protein